MSDFQPYIDAFTAYLKFEKRYSQHTVLAYSTDLRDFFDFLTIQYGQLPFPEIDYQQIRSWIAVLHTEEQNTAKTINRKISSLKSFFKYHIKAGNISHNPTAKIITPKISKKLPSFVKEEDMATLSTALDAGQEDWATLTSNLMIKIFYATGMRLSELINLKETQVDFPRRQIKVLGKGNKERSLPISPELAALIENYMAQKRREFEHPADALLVTPKGRQLYPKYAYLQVKKYLGDVKTLDKKSPHVLRHSFATHLMNHGAEINAVKELLGHSSLAATQVYTHNTIEKLKEVYKNAHPKA
ncbi:MAG: tyrosine-type recombinase/integrase [Niabella sp.]